MATLDRQHQALQTIFSFFLGLMVVAFVGISVNTFYQSPEARFQKERTALERKMQEIDLRRSGDKGEPSAADRKAQAAVQREMNELNDKIDALMQPWVRNTSIILVLCATVVMTISLYRSEQLRVVSNGLLLGGLFTMIYGAGWSIFAPGTSTARFLVILFALVMTVALGYLKFVRMKQAAPAAAGATAGEALAPESVTALEARVATLEGRLAAVSDALSGTRTPPE